MTTSNLLCTCSLTFHCIDKENNVTMFQLRKQNMTTSNQDLCPIFIIIFNTCRSLISSSVRERSMDLYAILQQWLVIPFLLVKLSISCTCDFKKQGTGYGNADGRNSTTKRCSMILHSDWRQHHLLKEKEQKIPARPIQTMALMNEATF